MNQEWHEKRRHGIGGSDCPAVCGVSPWRTPLQVWEQKRGLTPPQDDNPAMFWGRTLEPVIRQKYSDETGREVLLPTDILASQQHPFMLANIDGYTREPRVVEIKTTAYPTEWGEPGTDEIPLSYIFQVQHYMVVTGFPVADVPVLIGGRDFRIYTVEADTELQQMIVEKEAEFWRLVETGEPPAPVNYQDVVRLYRKSEAREVVATDTVEGWVDLLKSIRNQIKDLEGREEELKGWIMEVMAEADTLITPAGKALATWKQSKDVAKFNMDYFKKNHKTMYDKYLQTVPGSRRFLIKGEVKNGKAGNV